MIDRIKVGDRVRPRPEWRGDPNNIPSGRVIKREPFGRCGAFLIEGDHRAFTLECLEIEPAYVELAHHAVRSAHPELPLTLSV